MNTTATDSLREKLSRIEAELGEARDERVGLVKARDDARARFARARDVTPRSREFREADTAQKALTEHDAHIEDVRSVQVATLRMLGRDQPGGGDRNGPLSGEWPTGDGWEQVAREMCETRAEGQCGGLSLASLQPRALGVTPSEGATVPAQYIEGVIPKPLDRRFLAPFLPTTQLEGFGATDWRQTGDLTVSGEVERDPLDKGEKATVELDVTADVIAARMLAVRITGIARELLNTVEGTGQFLSNVVAYILAQHLDILIKTAIDAAKPAQGDSGVDLLAKVRRAVATMRDSGVLPPPARPDQITGLLVLNSQDAAELDDLRTGADAQPVFATRATGSASPLWGLQVIETAGEAKPLILDPAALGMLFTEPATLYWNPFSGQAKNEIELLIEAKVVFHVRNIVAAYSIDKALEATPSKKRA